jgi:hypothetical protein
LEETIDHHKRCAAIEQEIRTKENDEKDRTIENLKQGIVFLEKALDKEVADGELLRSKMLYSKQDITKIIDFVERVLIFSAPNVLNEIKGGKRKPVELNKLKSKKRKKASKK